MIILKQKVVLYENFLSAHAIYENINVHLKDNWKIHACINKNDNIIVVYEKELETWN